MKMVLLSGGIDSTTALATAIKTDPKVIAVTFTYNQQHEEMELKAAKEIAKYYQVEHRVIDLSPIFQDSQSALSVNNDLAIEEGPYSAENGSNAEVEFRNGVFLSILGSMAKQHGADEIFFGAHQDDSGTVYPDCAPEFIQTINDAIQLGTSGQVSVNAPFMYLIKEDIVKEGIKLSVPYELTYSCYKGTSPSCGVCGTCIDRNKAFKSNGLEIK